MLTNCQSDFYPSLTCRFQHIDLWRVVPSSFSKSRISNSDRCVRTPWVRCSFRSSACARIPCEEEAQPGSGGAHSRTTALLTGADGLRCQRAAATSRMQHLRWQTCACLTGITRSSSLSENDFDNGLPLSFRLTRILRGGTRRAAVSCSCTFESPVLLYVHK